MIDDEEGDEDVLSCWDMPYRGKRAAPTPFAEDGAARLTLHGRRFRGGLSSTLSDSFGT